MNHKFYDYHELPHPEIRQLIDRLHHGEADLDAEVMKALNWNETSILPTIELKDALSLIPETWWWHISHLEACVIPTTPPEGLPFSTAKWRNKKGRPITYRSDAHYDRTRLPSAICVAMLMAVYNIPAAMAVQATATDEEPQEVIEGRQARIAAWRDEVKDSA